MRLNLMKIANWGIRGLLRQPKRNKPGRRESYRPYLEQFEGRLVLSTIPTQFIAKMYTEALGRIPDTAAGSTQSGWGNALNYFTQNPAQTAANLENYAQSI